MSPEQPKPDTKQRGPASPPEPPPQLPPVDAGPGAAKKSDENVWKEDYDDLVTPEETPKPVKRTKMPWGAILITLLLILMLILWTIFSPNIMPQEGDTYTSSPTHASWGNYTGYLDIWAGNTSWGVSVSGHATSSGNRSIELKVLVTKVSERPGNWFFRGTAISLRNVSVFIGPSDNATFLASMSNHTELEYGVLATVSAVFSGPGTYQLVVKVRFLVYEVMRIGFIPLESVNVYPVFIDSPVVVT